jgi:hypothetical protein
MIIRRGALILMGSNLGKGKCSKDQPKYLVPY